MAQYVRPQFRFKHAGEIWIGRSFTSAARERYDEVFDDSGTLIARARLRTDQVVVGFGEGTIYVARTDPDDHLVYLDRYRLDSAIAPIPASPPALSDRRVAPPAAQTPSATPQPR